MIKNTVPPCSDSNEGVNGSKAILVARLDCKGESDPFLVAVKVDGKPVALVEARGAGYGTEVAIDVGPWEAADTLWHPVELIVDPLNLFKEVDETNNRMVGQIRMVPPNIGLNSFLTRFLGTDHLEITQATAGTTVLVAISPTIRGYYGSFELSARSGADMSFSETTGGIDCESAFGRAPITIWNWRPPRPGTYVVEFRVTPLSGESDRDSTDNVLTRTFVVR